MAARRKHWYYLHTSYCPVCGRSRTIRERRYGKRPVRWSRRHRAQETYDWCDG